MIIERQGAVLIDRVEVRYRSENVALLHIECRTKRVRTGCHIGYEDDSPGVEIEAVEGSVNLHESAQGTTDVRLDEFKGWQIFAMEGGKWNVSVALRR